ncbi:5-deoxy-glucuronate isomerase [Actinomadura macrotermitis]|uniref:5-deoxy-glucuronate isomerase n=1 Tax=Actinomadura macrotermitis TaxID=2585200 RepID=A0A7K0C4D6_9ACTN|nr:5-deoxy-glucuronate isomerase [Actinomadura macrotermitis]
MNTRLHLPAGTAAAPPYALRVTPEDAGWTYCGLRVLELPEGGGEHGFDTGDFEMIVLPLAGSGTVGCDGERFELRGRRDVFSRVSDFAYVPRDARVTIGGRGRFALAAARCERRLVPRYGAAGDVPVELRGAGPASRQVNDFGSPAAFPFADRLIACEVLTPGGNWSSFPPHKHDEDRPGESVLEEIYYFEVAGETGMAYQRVYGGPDLLAEVRSGDVVLVPRGWHGPSMAAPGHDLYYLNVMAGPGPERAWRICDDPAHAWIRDTWPGQPVDPRLPLTSPEGRS